MNNSKTFSPLENALDSLGRVALALKEKGMGEVAAWKGALLWGWHAAGLLAYLRLLPERENFDPWMQDYLHQGEPRLNVERDAMWDERRRLHLIEILDIFSERELPILKPEFYQGWQDRASRCKELRSRVARLAGGSIGAEQREQLLFLLAVYNRLVYLPAAVEIQPAMVRDAFPALLDFIEMLLDPKAAETTSFRQLAGECRKFLKQS